MIISEFWGYKLSQYTKIKKSPAHGKQGISDLCKILFDQIDRAFYKGG
jgi:hypothetical protein